MDLMDLLIFFKKKSEKYFKEPEYYTRLIKKRSCELFGNNIRVFLFGSVVKGNFTALSDIDVLVVVPELKTGLHTDEKLYIEQDLGDSSPFKIILCSKSQYEGWFKKFILDKCIEI